MSVAVSLEMANTSLISDLVGLVLKRATWLSNCCLDLNLNLANLSLISSLLVGEIVDKNIF